jgi:hypothetical protein
MRLQTTLRPPPRLRLDKPPPLVLARFDLKGVKKKDDSWEVILKHTLSQRRFKALISAKDGSVIEREQ